MKNLLHSFLKFLGIFKPLKKIYHRHFRSRGLGSWRPLVPEQEFSKSTKIAIEKLLEHESADEIGDYLEFGVSRGTSLAAVFHLTEGLGLKKMRLIGFDSFKGLPIESAAEGWTPGQFHSTLSATQRYLAKRNIKWNRVTLIKGWFDKTLSPKTKNDLNLQKASVIMVDCDIYSASKAALKFSLPLIEKRAVVIFDDWGEGNPTRIGQREAYQEVLEEYPEFSTDPLPS